MAADGPSRFEIATLPWPRAGRLGLSRLPGGDGPLDGAVGVIAAWGAATVISLTTGDELHAAGAQDLGAALGAWGIAWRHFPIADFSVPDAARERVWPALSRALRQDLEDGAGILLHCRGGQGRSGMIATRLLVERGVPGPVALDAVRSVRPGAVETPAQEAWALSTG